MLSMSFDFMNHESANGAGSPQPGVPELASHPLARLPVEDLDLIVELVRRSGSLKDLAGVYGVSYPTIRARLDRVIERLELALKGQRPDPVADLLATLVERGEMSIGGARAVRDLVRSLARDRAPSSDAPAHATPDAHTPTRPHTPTQEASS